MRAFVLTLIGVGGLMFGATVTAPGCGADAAFDCQAVCSRYADCYDANFNVSKCREDCRTASKNDPEIRRKADACEACIGDKSCISATFACGTDCASIIVQ